MIRTLLFVLLGLGLLSFQTKAQVTAGAKYTIGMLSQEPVNITATLYPTSASEVGDTTFTIYGDCSVKFKTYFVNGDQYDNIFNPNPTGIYLNEKHFVFYCGLEKTVRLNYSNVLDAVEFNFLGKNYLVLISFREDCNGENCRYRCYNLFDISNPARITQISFSSIFQGTDTFGEFNNDGVLDFVRVAPKPSKDYDPKKSPFIDNYLITAYSVSRNEAKQLFNSSNYPNYLYVRGDEEVTEFTVLQADWFFPVKDETGQVADPTPYFAEYISFDPLYRHLYSPDGVRIEKNRWSVFITDLNDLEAAQDLCKKIQSNSLDEIYIMVDQYGGNIKFQVFVGNFTSKETAIEYRDRLKEVGYQGKLTDFKEIY